MHFSLPEYLKATHKDPHEEKQEGMNKMHFYCYCLHTGFISLCLIWKDFRGTPMWEESDQFKSGKRKRQQTNQKNHNFWLIRTFPCVYCKIGLRTLSPEILNSAHEDTDQKLNKII